MPMCPRANNKAHQFMYSRDPEASSKGTHKKKRKVFALSKVYKFLVFGCGLKF